MSFFVSYPLSVLIHIFMYHALSLHVMIDILLTCGEHLHDRIISLREEVWAANVF